jgi:hypothetical protein
MVRPAQTARSERTRDALRKAALVRFLAQGVEETSAEQIAADAGVSLRTFIAISGPSTICCLPTTPDCTGFGRR